MRVDLNRDFHEKINYISLFHQWKIIPGRISACLNEAGVNAAQTKNLVDEPVILHHVSEHCSRQKTVDFSTSVPHFFQKMCYKSAHRAFTDNPPALVCQRGKKKKKPTLSCDFTLGQGEIFHKIAQSLSLRSSTASPSTAFRCVCVCGLEDHTFHWFYPDPSPSIRPPDCLISQQTCFLMNLCSLLISDSWRISGLNQKPESAERWKPALEIPWCTFSRWGCSSSAVVVESE